MNFIWSAKKAPMPDWLQRVIVKPLLQSTLELINKCTFCFSFHFSFFSRCWVQNCCSRCWIKVGHSCCLAPSCCCIQNGRSSFLTSGACVFCRRRFWMCCSCWYRRNWRAAFANTSLLAVLYQISGGGWSPTVSKMQLTILVIINVDTRCERVTIIAIKKNW